MQTLFDLICLWFVLNTSCCTHFVLLTTSRRLHHHVAYFLKAKLWEWAFILWFTYQYPVISCFFTWQMQQFALTGDATEMVMFVLDNKLVVAPASCWHKNENCTTGFILIVFFTACAQCTFVPEAKECALSQSCWRDLIITLLLFLAKHLTFFSHEKNLGNVYMCGFYWLCI